MASLSQRSREWWSRRQQAQQERQNARDAAQIPVLQLQESDEAQEPRWPTPEVLDMESEAYMAQGVPDIPLVFQTRTSNPPHPRTIGAGYDRDRQILRLRFRPGASRSPGGAIYDYFNVSEKEWEGVRRTISTGRYLDRQLAAKPYIRRW